MARFGRGFIGRRALPPGPLGWESRAPTVVVNASATLVVPAAGRAFAPTALLVSSASTTASSAFARTRGNAPGLSANQTTTGRVAFVRALAPRPTAQVVVPPVVLFKGLPGTTSPSQRVGITSPKEKL